MKKKILLGSIIAMASLQALGGLTGIDNLSSEPCMVRMILQNKKTTEWRNLNANPTGKTDQRGSKTVFYNINSKNVKIQWKRDKSANIIYTTKLIGDARDIYISNNGQCQIYEWNKSYSKANWHQALKKYPGSMWIEGGEKQPNVRIILQNGKTTGWRKLKKRRKKRSLPIRFHYASDFNLEDYRNVKIEWEPVDSNQKKPNFTFVTAPITHRGSVFIYNNGNYQTTKGPLTKASKINKR